MRSNELRALRRLPAASMPPAGSRRAGPCPPRDVMTSYYDATTIPGDYWPLLCNGSHFRIEFEFEFTVFVVEPRVRTALPSSAIDSTSI